MENFITFAKKSVFFPQKLFLTIFKKGKSIERPLALLCACIITWPFFDLPLCLQPLKKSWGGGIFDRYL